MERCLIQGLEQEIYMMSLEHLLESESKAVLKKNRINMQRKGVARQRNTRSPLKGLSMAGVGTI